MPGRGGGLGIGNGGTLAKVCPYILGPCCFIEIGHLLSFPVTLSSLDGSSVQ